VEPVDTKKKDGKTGRNPAPLLAALVLLAACSAAPRSAKPQAPELGAWGVDTASLSTTVRPGDDFYLYGNEGWQRTAKIPPGFSALTSFTSAFLRTEQQLADLMESIRTSPQPEGSPEAQVADLYRSYVDLARLNALGLSPLQPEIDTIRGLRTREEVARIMARPFVPSVVEAGVVPDPEQPLRYTVLVQQGGLGLPTPDYYLRPEAPFPGHRRAYRQYIEGVYRRAGIGDAAPRAAAVLALETAIARLHWSPTEMRDRVRMHHPMKTAELPAYAPGFEWAAFLGELKFSGQAEVVVSTDSAIRGLAKLFAATPVETWRSYLLFHCIDSRAEYLSEDWQQAHFDFHSRSLAGIDERRPLDKRAVQEVSDLLGENVGRAYVKRYFPKEHREPLDRMVAYVRDAFRERLRSTPWMDEETRVQALAKMERIKTRLAYPDRWHDFSTLRVEADDLVGNLGRRAEWSRADDLARLGESRRDWEWPLDPQEINAGYVASDNSINFPAAILQPPFFDPHADPAVNFGAIGAVIGHEIGHAFDDQGSRSDGEGRLRNWWTARSREQFRRRTAALVAQFDAFSPLEGMHVNGKLTLGENIGDLGGLAVALDAYHRFVAQEQAGRAPVLDGFTGDQRFFLAWAQVWRTLATTEAQRARLLADPHSPGPLRVNGVVRNLDAWYDAFPVQEGDKLRLAPDDRVRIW